MRYLPLTATLGVTLFVCSVAPARAQTTEHSIYVTVVDKEGTPVTDLTADAFAVREDGQAREVLRVARATEPIDLALLVDNSQAASPYITDLRNALRAFVTQMSGKGHAISLLGLADRPTILQDYTNNPTLLERGVDRVFAQPGSGMRLLDGLVDVSRGIQRRENLRRVIVTVTTEGTEFSNPDHDRVLKALRQSGAALYSLIITRPGGGPGISEEARSRGIVFDEGTRTTGGRQQQLLTSMALADALDRLARELENQLRVVYGRPGALVPPERVEISVTSPGLTARGTPAAPPTGRTGGN